MSSFEMGIATDRSPKGWTPDTMGQFRAAACSVWRRRMRFGQRGERDRSFPRLGQGIDLLI
ncbi:MAG: hypothetical protein ABFD89_08930 [Bryobacteraceae bacterium]